jgi:hypothetical protein
MPTRRDSLKLAGALALAGCDGVSSAIARWLGEDVPERVEPPRGERVDATHHLLSRAAYGPWPGDVEGVRALGHERWIDEQLDPDSIDDSACMARTASIDTVHLDPSLAFEFPAAEIEE